MGNINHDGFQDRLIIVKGVLQAHGLEATEIIPLAYEEDCRFPYNNFIYKIELAKPATRSSFLNAPACTTSPPASGILTIVIRLSNPSAIGLNNANRVENEVAAMYLARKGLQEFKPGLEAVIPAVYTWRPGSPATHEIAWMLTEYKAGVSLDGEFESLSQTQRQDVIGQIADILAGIQHSVLPHELDSYGGLNIDRGGHIVGGEMTIVSGGPWKTYTEFWQAKFKTQLKGADGSSALVGWKHNRIRERIDKFLANGISDILERAGVDSSKRVLVHGDLSMNNMLVDTKTTTVTALLDFDFSFVAPAAHEFFSSLHDLGGNTSGVRGPDPTAGKLSKAALSGTFNLNDVREEGRSIFTTARSWDEALATRHAIRPSNIQGIEVLDRLRQLEETLCPFRLVVPAILERQTPEEISEAKARAETNLTALLESFGW